MLFAFWFMDNFKDSFAMFSLSLSELDLLKAESLALLAISTLALSFLLDYLKLLVLLLELLSEIYVFY